MSANANGTPTSLGIPTFNPAQDIAGPLGVNEMMQSIDSKIAGRMFAPAAPADKQVVKWSQAGGAWVAGFVAPSELAQEGATDGQALLWSTASGKWVPKTVGLQYRKTTAKVVNTSVAATDLLNGEITIAAGVMGTAGMVRVSIIGDWLQNIGSTIVAPRFQVVLGATTLIDTGPGLGAATSATRGGMNITLEIMNLGVTNAQATRFKSAVTAIGGSSAGTNAFTTGEGVLTAAGSGGGIQDADGTNTTAVDTTVANALKVLVINGSASAAYETKLLSALIEVI